MKKTKEDIKIEYERLEHPALRRKEVKVETLESQKEELEWSMNASDYGTMITKEMVKIRKE
jgi:hypothetical protein|tara:strand:+ start:444 stop:626 length:183 start_codon:yes stop_codon:yes gene_type:complete